MVEEDYEDMPVDDEELEKEEKPIVRKTKPSSAPKIASRNERYLAVHQPQMDGIIDAGNGNKIVAVDTWDMLAKIYNKLEAIERAVGV